MRPASAAVLLVSLLPIAACAGSGSASDQPTVSVSAPAPAVPGAENDTKKLTYELGEPVDTVGTRFGGPGQLKITPLSVVYSAASADQKPEHDLFAVVVVRDENTGSVPAQESAPVEGGGWQWISTGGEQVEEGDGAALDVTVGDYPTDGVIQPGAFDLLTVVFDLTEAQRGGTLVYTDGDSRTFRWNMPERDAGPQAADVKKHLSP